MEQFGRQVYEELVKLNTRYDSLHNDVHELSVQFKRIDKIITGGTDASHGLVVAVDRLSQESTRRNTWVRAAVAGSVTAVFGFVGLLIKLVYK
jgi:hypothetical protein